MLETRSVEVSNEAAKPPCALIGALIVTPFRVIETNSLAVGKTDPPEIVPETIETLVP